MTATEAVFLGLHLGGLAVLVASFVATWAVGRVDAAARPPLWRRLRRLGWPIGSLLGVLSAFAGYPVYAAGPRFGETGRTWVMGVPFMTGASDEEGLYPGFGFPAIALNFLFWLLLPQFVLWVTSGRSRGRPDGATDRPSP